MKRKPTPRERRKQRALNWATSFVTPVFQLEASDATFRVVLGWLTGYDAAMRDARKRVPRGLEWYEHELQNCRREILRLKRKGKADAVRLEDQYARLRKSTDDEIRDLRHKLMPMESLKRENTEYRRRLGEGTS